MNILKISNSDLARQVYLDPSYISRLRNGHRKPSFEAEYLEKMVKYFVKVCKTNCQKETINKLLGVRCSDNISISLYETLMYEWLIVNDDKKHIEIFLEQMTDFEFKRRKTIEDKKERVLDLSEKTIKNGKIYYGFDGKRKAVLIFLKRILKNSKPQEIYLLSEGKMDWLLEDPSFLKKWSILLGKVVAKGNKIKIIHNINRSFDEMITAIKKWLPLYITGSIEPYYYPKLRDNVFKKTLFIAKDSIAITADTVGEFNKDQANIIYTDKEMIKILTKEFNYYLKLCRPLMRVYNQKKLKEYFQILDEFESEKASGILKNNGLSVLTLPESLLENLKNDQKISIDLLNLQKKRIKKFKKNLNINKFTEIIQLPSLKLIENNKISINFSNLLNNSSCKYTLITYKKHLENILKLFKSNLNYDLYIQKESFDKNYVLYIKEEVGVLIAKESDPSVFFAINESNMTLAFWDYLNGVIRKNEKRKDHRKTIIDSLEKEISEIEKIIRND